MTSFKVGKNRSDRGVRSPSPRTQDDRPGQEDCRAVQDWLPFGFAAWPHPFLGRPPLDSADRGQDRIVCFALQLPLAIRIASVQGLGRNLDCAFREFENLPELSRSRLLWRGDASVRVVDIEATVLQVVEAFQEAENSRWTSFADLPSL